MHASGPMLFYAKQIYTPCADAVGFTRLCATPDGKPDGLQDEIPTLFTVELTHQALSHSTRTAGIGFDDVVGNFTVQGVALSH